MRTGSNWNIWIIDDERDGYSTSGLCFLSETFVAAALGAAKGYRRWRRRCLFLAQDGSWWKGVVSAPGICRETGAAIFDD